jgi:D-apionolactonase
VVTIPPSGGGGDAFAQHGWRVALSLGEVGHIEHHGVELVRAVRVVARDEDWNTFEHTTSAPTLDEDGALRFAIAIEDVGTATVVVRLETERCEVTATIRPSREVDVNRLGLVVLLSPSLAGAPFEVVDPSGRTMPAAFPEHIAPHQPARDIRALRYAVDDQLVTLDFVGDVFEMEDQRNWTDASFKVYNRPLALPFPYRVGPSDTIEQSVRVTVAGRSASGLEARDRPRASSRVAQGVGSGSSSSRVARAVGSGSSSSRVAQGIGSGSSSTAASVAGARVPSRRVPEIGTSSGRHVDGPLPPVAPGAGPLLVELTADRASWPTIVGRAALEADALGVPVDLRVVAADADGLAAGLAAAQDLRLARIGVFDPVTHVTEAAGWDALRRWRDARPSPLPLVAGTRAHFTELNRTIERLPRDADLVAFSMTPMMHATDPEHVEESLAMQALVARDAVRLADGTPVVIGPVTFRRRFNAVATTPSPGSVAEAARGNDAVIGSEYAASWFERSVTAVSVPGVLSASWFEATGPRGLVGDDGALVPAGRAWYALVG